LHPEGEVANVWQTPLLPELSTWQALAWVTAVRLKVEQNQLVGVFDEIGILFGALKGA
jgi:hypothetical protein